MICTILTDGTELNGICRNEEEPPLVTVRSRLFTLIQTLVAQGYDEFWLNGEYVGYSEDTFTPSEFDLTPFIKKGINNKTNLGCVENKKI